MLTLGARDRIRIAAVGDIAMLHPPGPDLWRDVWDAADVRLANLEGPVVGNHPTIAADKPILIRLPPESVHWLQGLGLSAVSLANNHMMDWGAPALLNTRALLAAAGIVAGGAGPDREVAESIVFVAAGPCRTAFLSWACTIPPGFLAGADRAGIAGVRVRASYYVQPGRQEEQPGTPPDVLTCPLEEDLRRLEQRLTAARATADLVLLSIHWGVPPQYRAGFQDPVASYQKALAVRAARAGADAILGHHPHAPEGMGVVDVVGDGGTRQVPVLYSLGNYIFHPEYAPDGLLHQKGLYLSAPAMRPENRETCVATLELGRVRDRLSVLRVTLTPGVLDERGEALASNHDRTLAIAERLSACSTALGATVTVQDEAVTWQPSPVG